MMNMVDLMVVNVFNVCGYVKIDNNIDFIVLVCFMFDVG